MGCYARMLFYLLTNKIDYNISHRENLGKIPEEIPPVAKHSGAGLCNAGPGHSIAITLASYSYFV